MRKTGVLLALFCAALLALMAAKSVLTVVPPVRERSTATEFDASRAKMALAWILGDQRPHPADTAADDQVRNRIILLLQHIGLTPIVRDQLACNELYKARGVSCARVRNVIAVIGPRTGKAVLLNAHYDSTPAGPGAADDGIGVATLLEVGSVLQHQPLKRPVILLFNEGEELGLIGARAFLADPLGRNVDSLINLEARGVRGPVNMFETSQPNGAPIAYLAAAVDHPVANSLSTDVYRLLPNYTDVNSFSARGWLTLNLAPIGNETRYHSPGDDVAALDPATLQQMGDQTLALARALANDAPQTDAGDRVFMNVAGALITLPLEVGVVLLIALLIGFATLAWTRGALVRGVAVVLGAVVGSTALPSLALALIGAARQGMFWRAHPLWTHLATYASVMFVSVVLLATLGRRADVRQLRAAFWLLTVFIGAIIGLIAPGGIIFFLFPPLLALIGMVAARWWPKAERIGAIAAIFLFFLSWGGMLALLEELLNGGPMWIFAPLGALLILPILIEGKALVDAVRLHTAVAIAGVLALAGWAAAAAAPAYSADRQQRFVIEHVTDLHTFKSWWSVINDGAPLPDSYRAAGTWSRGKLPFSERPRWIAAAPADAAIPAAPGVQRLSEVRNGSERTLTLRLLAAGFDRILLIGPEDARIRAAGTPGFVRPIDSAAEEGKYSIDCFGRSCDGATLQLTIDQPEPVEFTIVGSHAGLPPSAAALVAARPKFARPQYNRDETIAFARIRL
jgi:hypothetical protein